MYRIMKKEQLAPNIYSMDILAPRVAKSAKPGQFIVLITGESKLLLHQPILSATK